MEYLHRHNQVLDSGAMQGRTVEEIAQFQWSYIEWLHSKDLLSTSLYMYLRGKHYPRQSNTSTHMTYGTHTGKLPDWPLHNQEATTMMETMKNVASDIREEITDETLTVAQIQAGRIIYTAVQDHLTPFLPKWAWYEKLFTSKARRDLATMLVVFGLLHLVRSRYDHYALSALTSYLNYELQSVVADKLKGLVLDDLLKLPTKK